LTLLNRFIDVMKRMRRMKLAEMPKVREELTISQMVILKQILASPGSRLQQIAELVGVTAPSMSVALRKLEESDWIYRVEDPLDKRASCFHPSKSSNELFKEVQEKQKEGLQQFLSALEVDEQDQLVFLLEKAIGKLENKKFAQRSD